ncbi:hypothetical protein BD626DRAFT_571597 [Schizophyllum amplum]|uniref:N-acetyltransferase domain-containing protein n=1 Tax=Schizophyllum amplum TaxID=97359 RepID=A0A550C6V6_9AGAR|nr:hypothetical protein BD626DRAFT_571597 [Auriculariopsis ampla]
MTTLSLGDVQVKCIISNCTVHPFLRPVTITASHPRHKDLGTLEAYKIARVSRLAGHFFNVLDEKSSELADFGSKVLDNNMKVFTQNVENDYHKGLGCWGYEMNEGDIIYVHELDVLKKFENQGIATLLLNTLLTSEHVKKGDIVYCWPTPTKASTTAERQAEVPRVNRVFRKVGFRRVGRTTYFGYSPDPAHPSRLISSWRDLDIKPYKFPARATDMSEADARDLMQAFPIQTAMDPPFLFGWRRNAFAPPSRQHKQATTEEIVDMVHATHTSNPALLHIRDDQGCTPIFVAADSGELPVIRALLSYDVCPEEILSRENAKDRNAIEAYEQQQPLLGFSDDVLIVGYMLRQAAGEDVGTVVEYMNRESHRG